MLESFKSDKLEYIKLSPEEMKQRGILGRLAGIIADYKNPTRNGRLYSEELWDKTFEDPIMKEKIKNRCLFGELGHPEDRLEIDIEKVAICMAEEPKKGKDGKLYSVFDILDTPNGRILKTLCDYGCTIGVSSRGNGETDTDYNGNESVIPDTYQCECWDAVLIPAVESARMSYMKESIGNKTLKQALNESLKKATSDDRKVMTETLKNLNIGYSDSKKESNNIKNNFAAKDTGAEVLKTLQESLLAKEQAQGKITELQEKLSVCYAKEASMEDELNKYKAVIRNLTESAKKVKDLQNEVNNLNEELKKKEEVISQTNEKVESLLNKNKLNSNKQSNLKESLSNKEDELKQANVRLKRLSETLKRDREQFIKDKQSLQESYENLKKDYTIKKNEYSSKLTESNKLIEKYRLTAKKAVDKYIESKSLSLGIDSREVINKLPKNYSFNDIDSICEELSNYNLQMSSLPFDVKKVKNVSISNNKQPLLKESLSTIDDGDEIDESLIKLANTLMQN